MGIKAHELDIGVFAEFPSAVAAVDTAVEFQKQIKARNDKDTTEVKA